LLDLLARVHDKRSIAGDRLTKRGALDEQEARRSLVGPYAHLIGVVDHDQASAAEMPPAFRWLVFSAVYLQSMPFA
jgi:hypothetical protein